MTVSPVAGSTSKPAITGLELEKLKKGAREFEAIMVEQLWKGMKTDSEESGSSQTLADLGTQAMATGVAKQGGLGVAKMILRQLAPDQSDEKAAKNPLK